MAFFGAGEFSRRGRGATFQSVVTNCSVLHHIHYNKRGRGMTMEREESTAPRDSRDMEL